MKNLNEKEMKEINGSSWAGDLGMAIGYFLHRGYDRMTADYVKNGDIPMCYYIN